MQEILLSKDSKSIIEFAVKYCNLVKIQSVFLTKTVITAKQDETAVYLVEPGDYDFLEFDTLYIDRIGSLAPRFKMFESGDAKLYAVIKDSPEGEKWVQQLIMRNNKTDIRFNCGNPARLNRNRLPKSIKESLYYRIQMTKENLDTLSRGLSAMGASTLKLYSDEGAAMCEVKDIEGDLLVHRIADDFLLLDGSSPEDFSHEYSFKTMIPLFKDALKDKPSFDIEITRRGIMKLEVNGLSLYVIPEL